MKKPNKCPKGDGCSAPVCPLDKAGIHLRDEPICFYAMELVKPGADQRFAGNDLIWLQNAIDQNLEWLLESRDIRKRLAKSAFTRPRMANSQFITIAKG